MSVDVEMLELEREVQACEVRLGLVPFADSRHADWLHDLKERREMAADKLVELKAKHGSQPDPPLDAA